MMSTGRRFSLGIIFLAVALGIYVTSQSMNRVEEGLPDEAGSSLLEDGGGYEATGTGLSLDAITEKTEYMCGEEITVECVVINDSPRAVNTTMPSNVGATTYSKADPDSKIRTACDISWVKREIEIPANSRKTITTFRFRCETVGEFVIDVHGYPLIEVMIGVPHAWIMANRVGEGGTGPYRDVNQTDVNDFTHLVKAMKEDAAATRWGLVHADHMTQCPAKEAIEIVEFFGEEYQPDLGYYDYKVVLDDGRKYLFSIRFSWETPIVK